LGRTENPCVDSSILSLLTNHLCTTSQVEVTIGTEFLARISTANAALPAMKFCMVTTFYPPYHYGGDAVYVYRLSQALAKRGHQVDVIHSRDAYDLASARMTPHRFDQIPGVTVHTLQSRLGGLSALSVHQTGRPWFKQPLKALLEDRKYDVIHFHNVSLIGAGALALGAGIKLLTLHDYWLLCPLHSLWKFDREVCQHRQCLSCTVRARRPPQLWRYTGFLPNLLRHVDQLIAPSRFAQAKHKSLMPDLPIAVLPHFASSETQPIDSRSPRGSRPYFLFVGRLEKLKGVQSILDTFRHYHNADLIIAGAGTFEPTLRQEARDLPNVKFLGWLPPPALRQLYSNAIALIVPSLWEEVFGLVLLEAFAEGTPALVRNLGAMPEVVADAGGGIVFENEEELLDAMKRLQGDSDLRNQLGENARSGVRNRWGEDAHILGYFRIIDQAKRGKEA
jgi:glycosyltransferase involved in cell wall biosynthesis